MDNCRNARLDRLQRYRYYSGNGAETNVSAPLIRLPHKHMDNDLIDKQLSRQAKAIVALAFRNGPIENVHAGKLCPTCERQPGYSRISDPEMKEIMKNAVDRVYALLWLKENNPVKYTFQIDFGSEYTTRWDDPTPPEDRNM